MNTSVRAAALGAAAIVLVATASCGTTNNTNCSSNSGSSSSCTINNNGGAASPVVAGTPSPPSSTEAPAESPTASASAQGAIYLDDVARNCRVALTTGQASINGTPYTHAVLQWAGDTSDTLTVARRATRFQATIGLRDDAADRVQVKFELDGDGGRQLYLSRVIGVGDSEAVDIPLDGVFRITLRVQAVSRTWGYAGWGDARIMSSSSTGC